MRGGESTANVAWVNSSRIVASTESGLVASGDRAGAGSWQVLHDGPLALLTWASPKALTAWTARAAWREAPMPVRVGSRWDR
jgi:hypothetical protein